MRAVVQRVKQASVSINDKITAEIKQGLLVLLGIEQADSEQDISWLSKKICQLRIFPDKHEKKFNKSLLQINGGILIVSQFTLHASTKKGNRPSFLNAGKPDFAQKMYENFIQEVAQIIDKNPATGTFGASMQVGLINDGPVTIMLDSKNKE